MLVLTRRSGQSISLEDLWEDLKPSLVPLQASAADAARMRLAFFGGAVALLGILTKASISGETAAVNALDALKAELRREANPR